MALNINRKQESSVVSGKSRNTSSVVGGPRSVHGRVIGEVLSGGRNVLGVKTAPRYAPRPTRDSARHSRRPQAKKNNYNDFGFEAFSGSYADDSLQPPVSVTGNIRNRPQEFNIFEFIFQALSVASACFFGLFMLVVVYYTFFDILISMPALFAAPIPLVLAVFLGFKVGAKASRQTRLGILSMPVGMAGTLLGAAVVAVFLHIYAVQVGIFPIMTLLGGALSHVPKEFTTTFRFMDMFIAEMFNVLGIATYFVVPLFGGFLGFVFSKK